MVDERSCFGGGAGTFPFDGRGGAEVSGFEGSDGAAA